MNFFTADQWLFVSSICIAAIVWLVRLEGQVKRNREAAIRMQGEKEKLELRVITNEDITRRIELHLTKLEEKLESVSHSIGRVIDLIEDDYRHRRRD